jgi:hypothetical protein
MKINAKQSNSLTTTAAAAAAAAAAGVSSLHYNSSASTMTALHTMTTYAVHDDCIVYFLAPALNLQTLRVSSVALGSG